LAFLTELFFRELLTLGAISEPYKQVAKLNVAKELLLGFLAVLVHGVSNNIEVNGSLNDLSLFFLVVSVRVDH
jgi:hypothetical protein